MEGAAGGLRVIEEVDDFVLSATLVAVIVTVCVEAIGDGAVYKPPAEIEPTPLGVMVHVTEVFVAPVMIAANCCVSEANKLAVGGVTTTATGCRVTVAVADFVLSATLVAVTVTVWVAGTEAG